jgi:hypothetical protein
MSYFGSPAADIGLALDERVNVLLCGSPGCAMGERREPEGWRGKRSARLHRGDRRVAAPQRSVEAGLDKVEDLDRAQRDGLERKRSRPVAANRSKSQWDRGSVLAESFFDRLIQARRLLF